MDIGVLYFIRDSFYTQFSKYGLLVNKGIGHSRPCCYCLPDNSNPNIFWMIPISSQLAKYKSEYNHSMQKYGMCDNIHFGYVLGQECAFLPQNMFPVTLKYIDCEYLNPTTNQPIKMPRNFISQLNKKARKKIKYNFSGRKFGMSDIVSIYNILNQNP